MRAMEQRLSALAAEWAEAELSEAKRVGDVGYIARLFCQVALPHSRHEGTEWERRNGRLSVSVLTPARLGLPYGTIPRILLIWTATEAVRTKEPVLVLGHHLAGFMSQMGLTPTGGRWGTIPRLKAQMRSTFGSAISWTIEGEGHSTDGAAALGKTDLWWDPHHPDQGGLWQSTITLSPEWFAELLAHPVPVDLTALRVVRRSPLAIDLLSWLTYRLSYLRQSTTVPWEGLQAQFGAAYADLKHFKPEVRRALGMVVAAYPAADVQVAPAGLLLRPSPTLVRRLR